MRKIRRKDSIENSFTYIKYLPDQGHDGYSGK